MEVNGKIHGPDTLPSVKQPRYPLSRRLGVPQIRSGGSGEDKRS